MLRASDIHVALAGNSVLEGAEFRAEAGQITAIAGPNGSGKTTLLRAITQDLPYRGRITLDGEDLVAIPGWKLATRRAVLPQASRIAFPFTVLEIVRLGLTAAAGPAPESRASDALIRVGLAGFEGRFYQELSGEVMDLVADYAARGGGVVAVMHDLNLTAIYAASVAMLARGRVVAQGAPDEVLTDARLSRTYGCDLRVNATPDPPATFLLPHMARRAG